MRYLYTVRNIRTNEVTTVNSIEEFGRNIDAVEDIHANWFFHNLDNMTMADYANTADKTWMIFNYKGEFMIERKGENTVLSTPVVDGNATKRVVGVKAINPNQAEINKSLKQISTIKGFLITKPENTVVYNAIIAKNELLIAKLAA